jgi:cell shape-determining protein MreD
MRGRSDRGIYVVVAVLVILHFVLRIGMGWGELAPDLLVLALLLAARELRAGAAAATGFFLGVLEGAMLPDALGSVALAFVVLGYLGARSRELISGDSLVVIGFYLFVGKGVADALLFLFAGALVRPAGASTLLLLSPLAALYVMGVGLLAISAYRAVS